MPVSHINNPPNYNHTTANLFHHPLPCRYLTLTIHAHSNICSSYAYNTSHQLGASSIHRRQQQQHHAVTSTSVLIQLTTRHPINDSHHCLSFRPLHSPTSRHQQQNQHHHQQQHVDRVNALPRVGLLGNHGMTSTTTGHA